MYDFAVNTLNRSLSEFHNMFINSDMANQFEIANPAFVAGKNGCEVAKLVIYDSLKEYPKEEDVMYLDKSPEYNKVSQLKRLRSYARLSQRELATAMSLATALGCKCEDLIM